MDSLRKRLTYFGGSALIIITLGGAVAWFILSSSRVYIDTATISAPLIGLAPTSPGRLDAIYVKAGDIVPANTKVAEVGTQVIATKVAGLVASVNEVLGANVTPGENVVTIVDPSALRVVGKIDENKGLADVAVGDPVVFTVDAYGGKEFKGIVDEIAPTSNASDIVFSVSNAREEQTFNVKARFDTSAYPELKNGMSARMWVYKQ